MPCRLIAVMRANASASISVIGASPPAMLTPTLLCRMSIRPHWLMQAVAIAAMSSSLVTSARTATASPPSSRICLTVSSAAARSRSAASTLAPSRASSTAVARPLPVVCPGV